MAKKLVFDPVLFAAVIVLAGLGLAMVYSASAAFAGEARGLSPFLARQAAAAALGLAVMAAAMHVDYRRLGHPAVVLAAVGGAVALLVGVLFAPEVNGTRRWFFVGGLSVQPSELAKLALVLYLAYQIAAKGEGEGRRELLLPCLLVPGLMAGLILLEPDLGTAFLLAATTLLLLFLAGLPWRYLLGSAALLAPALWFLIVSVPYRRQRLFAFLEPDRDPLGAGFQALQSLIAVGSGGLFGLGPGESVQKLYFLPHPHSDFIFSIVAEELGLAGALTILGLFAILLWRGVRAGLQAPDPFGRYLAWGLTGILVLQALINISVALALMPTKGIPLPFVSYGGSSLVVSMAACGVLLNVSQHG